MTLVMHTHHVTHECSKSLPNAIIERTIIWILAWNLYFSSAAAAAGRGCAPSPGPASPRRRRRGSRAACSASAPLLSDAAAASAGSARGGSRRRSLGELRSFAGVSFSRQLGNSLSGMIENTQRKYKHDLQHIWLPLQLHLQFRDKLGYLMTT